MDSVKFQASYADSKITPETQHRGEIGKNWNFWQNCTFEEQCCNIFWQQYIVCLRLVRNGQEPVRTPLKETQDEAEDRDIWASLLDRLTSPSAATRCWEGGGPRLQCEISRTSPDPRELIFTLLRIANTSSRPLINRHIFTAFKPIYI